MKNEFLLEIGTEEIPAGFCHVAGPGLLSLFAKLLESARIPHDSLANYATPRRLILTARIESQQPPVEIERTGPPKASAFDDKGNPTKAAIGFAKSQGVDVADLEIVEKGGKEVVAVRKTEGGRPTAEVLSEALPDLMEKIPFPKTMRWMDMDVRFGRPVHWIVALFDGKVIPCRFGNIESGNTSRGHRFIDPGEFVVTSLEDLRTTLESQGVTIDQDQRGRKIRQGVEELAASAGFRVFDDPELLDEVTFLVESPYPLMGEFAEEFLELPAPILTTCMKKHQRYFSVTDSSGSLTNRFIAINNTPVKVPATSVKGHQRVLKARLEDARFYFLEDRKRPLISRLEELKGVVFHSKLGTSFEKVSRFSQLARGLAETFAPDKIEEIERAARLAKCDLETGIVYEFPEVQGIIGSAYAEMDGESPDVAAAVREHYLPAFAGDRLPDGVIGSVVSIADRIDTIVGCFGVGLLPTGTADPYALRRHAFAIIQLLVHLDHPLFLRSLVREALSLLGEKRKRDAAEVELEVMEFFRTRFVNLHTSLDFPLDVVEAVVRARFEDVVDARRRVEALSEWKRRDDFDAIMIGVKRVVNILKDAESYVVSEDLLVDDGEKALFKAFTDVREKASTLIDEGRYSEALEMMAELKAPIDRFFDEVMVMVEEESFRHNRLALLQEIAELFSTIADFSFVGSTAEVRH
jgi:glycyl-tRNA synthetase beta chain